MEVIRKEHVHFIEGIQNKKQLFSYLSQYMADSEEINELDKELFENGLWEREKLSVTGIGYGIAIPHIQNDIIKRPTLVCLKSDQSIEYESLEGNKVSLILMIAMPKEAGNQHLKLLASLSRKIMDETYREKLMRCENEQMLFNVLKENNEIMDKEDKNMIKKGKILAVTACPTGIAHTYMAAENIEKAAKEMGYDVKVETNGSSGAENVLTAKEIEEADAIIIAADTKVQTARFNGKRVLQTSVTRGIKEAENLIKESLNAEIYYEDMDEAENVKKPGIYANLMSGVSNMIPLVVGGGILIAISFMWGINSANPDHAQFNQFAAWMKQVGDASFGLMLPILAGFISYSIADRPGLAPGLVGGVLAANGGSGFLGALVAGFLAGYVVEGLKKAFRGLPKSLDGIKPVLLYPLLSIFIVGMIIVVILNPIMSEVNQIITGFLNNLGGTNKILLGLVLGMMMAADLGGPINKAAYAFSIAMLEAGNYEIMGAVMTSGMVPAVGVALATSLYKKKFTQEERNAAKANYIMGLSFICEGAIPYAAADPKAIIPSLIAGAGLTGALSMAFGVGVPAPHGGVFVLPVVHNVAMFIVVIAIGVVATALLIGLLKKDIQK
ncbi:MAG: fructose-specific PTS transporter subunit EIIC [Lachnospiraceae bacterium]|nr:fructose-specific PTS transporter subunit EIIC [Lachnospiraceae bacterium]